MQAIKDPVKAAIVAGVLRYLFLRYPEYRDVVEAVCVGLGVGGGMTFLQTMRPPTNGTTNGTVLSG